jgi:hypothetical protein
VDNNKIENEIPLFPLMVDDTEQLLRRAGFNEIRFLGDFKGTPFNKESSYMLIINAR